MVLELESNILFMCHQCGAQSDQKELFKSAPTPAVHIGRFLFHLKYVADKLMAWMFFSSLTQNAWTFSSVDGGGGAEACCS